MTFRRRTISIILIASLALIIIAAIGAVKIYPYIKKAPITEEEAKAAMAEFEKLAIEIEKRPKDDRKAFQKLFVDWKDRLYSSKTEVNSSLLPPLPKGFQSENEEYLNILSEFSDALGEIVDDGFVWQIDRRVEDWDKWDEQYVNFMQVRHFVYWESAGVYLEAVSGDTSQALKRIQRLLSIITALYESPGEAGVNPMVALALEGLSNYAVVSVIPYLSSEELLLMADMLQKLPPTMDVYIKRFQIDTYARTREFMSSKPTSKAMERYLEYVEINIPTILLSALGDDLLSKWLQREKLAYLGFNLDRLEKIISGIPVDEWGLDYLQRNAIRSIFVEAYGAEPEFTELELFKSMLHLWESEQKKRANVINALAKEAELRSAEMDGERKYPYEEHIKIVVRPNEAGIGLDRKP